MKTEIEIWLAKDGKEFLKEIGVKKAQVVLDFGCSVGHYPDLTVRDPTTLKIKEITPVDLKSCHYIPF